MLHNYINDIPKGDHYAVGVDSNSGCILIQIQENGNQVRIPLTLNQTKHLIELLSSNYEKLTEEYCELCGKLWIEHDFGVPSPTC